MSLILIEGFGDSNMNLKWDGGSAVLSTGTTNPRISGGRWGALRNSGATLYKSFTASDVVVLGCGWKLQAGSYYGFISFFGDVGATQHITVIHTASNTIEIRRGSHTGTLLASSEVTLTRDVWQYLEISVTVSDSIGEVHVRLNGGATDIVNFTGDTKNGGTNSTVDRVQIYAYVNDVHVSDIYILNDAGSSNNDFLGDVAVCALSPNGNGNSSQLTGSDGNQTDNYLLVDDKPFSGTDYTYSSTSGHKDTYAMEDLPATASTVYGVQVTASMRKDDAGLGQARHVLRSGGTDYVGSTETLTTSATTYVGLYEQDPATSSAWTVSGVNSAEAGMEVV